ncbi:galanin receptor 2b-like [Diadema antillarum]|uniref:galanin receptor 2b-like n=1 Tax=Diadema antillarum TaxID=105358 RepID=UPI003A8B0497
MVQTSPTGSAVMDLSVDRGGSEGKTRVLQLICSVLGIFGNLLVLLALFKRGATHHTTDIFIGALGLADFLTSVFILPLPVAKGVPDTLGGAIYCKVIFSRFLMWMSIHASAYTLTGMSVERFLAVIFPLRFSQWVTRRRVIIYITAVWMCAVPSSLFTITYEVSDEGCKDTKTRQDRNVVTNYLFVLRIGIPALTMTLTHIIMAVFLHRQANRHISMATKDGGAPMRHIAARNRVVKMTAIVVLVYLLSIGPHQIAVTTTFLRGNLSAYLFSPLYYVFTFLAFINSCANPFIYAARYPKFRRAILDIFKTTSKGGNKALFDNTLDSTGKSRNTQHKQPAIYHVSQNP